MKEREKKNRYANITAENVLSRCGATKPDWPNGGAITDQSGGKMKK